MPIKQGHQRCGSERICAKQFPRSSDGVYQLHHSFKRRRSRINTPVVAFRGPIGHVVDQSRGLKAVHVEIDIRPPQFGRHFAHVEALGEATMNPAQD